MTARPAAAVAPVKPNVGGIYQNIPFTGSPRNPQLAVSFPSCDSGTTMKVYKACDSGIKAEFTLNKSAESDMHSFKTEVKAL